MARWPTPRGPEQVSRETGNVRRPELGTASAHLGKTHTGKIELLQRWTLEACAGKKVAVSKGRGRAGEFNDERTSARGLGLRRRAGVRIEHGKGRGLPRQGRPSVQVRFHLLPSAGRIVLAPWDARSTLHQRLSWDQASQQ